MKKINVIGCGRVGRSLIHLWNSAGIFAPAGVVNSSLVSAQSAVEFIGAGHACASISDLLPAEVFFIATPDSLVLPVSTELLKTNVLQPGNILLICSGILSTNEFQHLTDSGVSVASVHPIKSFARPEIAIETFAGTFCGAEGAPEALAVLVPAFESIGGKVFSISADTKAFYHAAPVFACNYLVALIEMSLQTYEYAGVCRSDALRMLKPLVNETIENIFLTDTGSALTGPIRRGDTSVVERHITALVSRNSGLSDSYKNLGLITLEITKEQNDLPDASLAALEAVLKS